MKYDFDRVIDRRGTASYKWDIGENEIPMWVADMDFEAAPPVIEALKKRLGNGVFGYSDLTPEWYDAYIGWWKDRHGMEYVRDDLIFATGVVPILSSCVRKLTTENENVVMMTPVYNCFFSSVVNSGRRVLDAPLKFGSDGCSIDFAALERALADPQTSMLFLCNPHNPTGRIWTAGELSEVGRLCLRYGVTVISDEIHCDLTDPGKEYVPFLRAAPECEGITVVCMAPTKAFNIAGLQTACAAVREPKLRHKVWRALNTDEVGEPNAFAVTAAVAAFTGGGEWLSELRRYLYENKLLVESFISERLPGIKVLHPDATYLIWMDMSGTGLTRPAKYIREKTGLVLSEGVIYGEDAGRYHVRMNVACPRSVVKEGLARLETALKDLI